MMKLVWEKAIAIGSVMGVSLLVLMEPGRQEMAIAQEIQGCFMVTSSGRSIPLDGVCDGTSVPQSRPRNPGVFQAPIKRRLGGIPIIGVTFNGQRTFDMIVDTGASGTLITQEMARMLQVEAVDSVTSTIADGSQVKFDVGYVQSIAVNGAMVKDVAVAIAPRMNIGLLGHDFFGEYDVQIKQDVVEFRPRS